MICKELNPIGNFDSWQPQRLDELRSGKFVKNIGQTSLYEDDKVQIWSVSIDALERIGFRKISSNIKVTFEANGLGISHQDNGKIIFVKINAGDVFEINVENDGTQIWDFENVGFEAIELILFEYKK